MNDTDTPLPRSGAADATPGPPPAAPPTLHELAMVSLEAMIPQLDIVMGSIDENHDRAYSELNIAYDALVRALSDLRA